MKRPGFEPTSVSPESWTNSSLITLQMHRGYLPKVMLRVNDRGGRMEPHLFSTCVFYHILIAQKYENHQHFRGASIQPEGTQLEKQVSIVNSHLGP